MIYADYDTRLLIAQLIGFVALFFSVASFQAKSRKKIIVFQILSNTVWVIQFFMLGEYTALVTNFIGIIRNVIYAVKGKWKLADSKVVPICSIALFITSGIITYKTSFDILPVFAMCISSITYFLNEERKIRYLSILVIVPWLIFSIHSGSIASIMSDSFNLISVLVAIARYDLAEKIALKNKLQGSSNKINIQ